MKYFNRFYSLILILAFIFLLNISLLSPKAYADAPQAPRTLRAVSGHQKVYLNWQHSPSFFEDKILGYKLYTSSDGGTTFDNGIGIVAPEGGILNNYYIVENLSNDFSYMFRLSTYNSTLEESNYIESNIAIPVNNSQTDNTAPEDISRLEIIPGNESVEIRFDHSLNTLGDLIGYNISYSDDNGQNFSSPIYIGYNNEYILENLENDQDYIIRVVAVDAVGNESSGVIDQVTPTQLNSVGTGVQLGDLPISTPTFKDVDDHWARSYIEYLETRNILSGYADGTFRPDETITRAEAVTLLHKASDVPLDTDIPIQTFIDVDENYGLALYIENAYSLSIIDGFSDGTFQPDKQVSRAEFAKIFVNFHLKKFRKVPESFAKFSDVPFDNPFAPYIYAAYKDGIIQGYEDGSFRPNESITRAQAATMVSRLFLEDPSSTIESTIEELQMLSLINTTRTNLNLQPYTLNPFVSAVSRAHVEDIVNNLDKELSYFSSDGLSPSERLDQAGILYFTVSENLAATSTKGITVTEALQRIHEEIMKQPDNVQNQKANILSVYKSFTDVGIGIFVDENDERVFVVVDFVEIDD